MSTLILGRPLTFGDSKQIEYIKERENSYKLEQDDEFKYIKKDYRELENKIEKLEDERDDFYRDLQIIGEKYGIKKNELYKYI